MREENRTNLISGMRNGIPIALGYFAVSFALGITAKQAGLSPFQAGLASFFTMASAGEYAGFTVIAECGTYVTMALMILVANARYLLMSCALTQRLPQSAGLGARMLVGFGVTDEIFGISIACPGYLSPWFTLGALLVATPGWTLGTVLGVIMGELLPANVVSALGVGLYGMFLAIIIPPARKSKIIAGLVLLSMGLSYLFARLPLTAAMSSGSRIIVLTILLSAGAALLFPVQEEKEAAQS